MAKIKRRKVSSKEKNSRNNRRRKDNQDVFIIREEIMDENENKGDRRKIRRKAKKIEINFLPTEMKMYEEERLMNEDIVVFCEKCKRWLAKCEGCGNRSEER